MMRPGYLHSEFAGLSAATLRHLGVKPLCSIFRNQSKSLEIWRAWAIRGVMLLPLKLRALPEPVTMFRSLHIS